MLKMTDHGQFLIVDDDEVFADVLGRALKRRGFSIAIANNEEDAIACSRENQPKNVVLDLKLGQTSGLHLIPRILSCSPQSKIVVLTGYSSIPTTVEAIKLGASNYLCKPVTATEIIEAFEETVGNPDIGIADSPPSVDRLEWEHIQKVLADNAGNISATARALGMHRRTLQRKLQKKPVSS